MESSKVRKDTAKTDPRTDGSAAATAEPLVRSADHARTVDAAPKPRTGDSPFEVLDEILDEMRAMRRERSFTEFSLAQLAGAIAQAFAICALCFALYWSLGDNVTSTTYAFLAAIVFQLMALTGFSIAKRR